LEVHPTKRRFLQFTTPAGDMRRSAIFGRSILLPDGRVAHVAGHKPMILGRIVKIDTVFPVYSRFM
jgi:hypothetical protein